MDEIPTDVDIARWSRYRQETFNGAVMRMAVWRFKGHTAQALPLEEVRRVMERYRGRGGL